MSLTFPWYCNFTTGVDVSPSIPNLATVEGGGGDGGGGSDGGAGGGDGTGGSGAGDGDVMVCLELTEGNLQRNVTLTAMTVSSPTSTGKRVGRGFLMSMTVLMPPQYNFIMLCVQI